MATENSHLGSSPQNGGRSYESPQYRNRPEKSKKPSTSHRKVTRKKEISLSPEQYKEASWLFRQYEKTKPGWLRRRTVINQRRRKLLNDIWREAGLDGKWCWLLYGSDDWSGVAHSVWHQINGGTR